MSCGCGCCPKCGCQATCTCNQNMWSLESWGDFSYTGMKTVADELNGQYNFARDTEYSSQSDFAVFGYEKTYAKEEAQWQGGGQEQGGSQWQLLGPSWE